MKFKSESVVIHSDTIDGYTSAWCLRTHGTTDYKFIAWKETDNISKLFFKKCTIYFLDIAPPLEFYHKLREDNNNRVFLIDNKEKNRELYGIVANDPDIIIDSKFSCCEIMWSKFSTKTFPIGLTYIADYTMNRNRMQNIKDIIFYLKRSNLSLDTIDLFITRMTDATGQDVILKEGKIIKEHYDCLISNALKQKYEGNILGYIVPMLNATEDIAHTLASILCKDVPFSAVWFVDNKGMQRYVLKSDSNGIDVSEIARQYGGAGHSKSSGFTIKRKDFFIL